MTLRKTFLLAWTLVAGSVLVACGPEGSSAPANTSAPAASAKRPTGSLDVAVFQGGYGLDFFEQAAKEYQEKNPDAKITVWGNPRVWEQLRPKFVAGTPPDLSWPGWGFAYWPMTYEGQLLSLDEALDGPAFDGTGKWRDTFEPALLKLGQYEGKQYMLPYHFNVMGWWYDPKLFKEKGWTPPKTWSELMALSEKIKAAGMAPITFQGKYPYYMTAGFLIPWVVAIGGPKAMDDAQSLVPGAWKSPAMLRAATMIKELRDKGFFQAGANGMTHTESQTEFLNHRAAMIPCGTWLPSEMKNTKPPGAEMAFMLPPVPDDAVEKTGIGIGIEPWVVPAKSKNPSLAIDLYKYMTSLPKARQFVQEKGTLMAIKGANEGELPELLKPPAEAFLASKAVWSAEFRLWYPALATEESNAMSSLINGTITPQQYCDRVEAAAEKVRKDSRTPKHVYSR
jgi:N-acetylglucosamine transport system substrate-binding protein